MVAYIEVPTNLTYEELEQMNALSDRPMMATTPISQISQPVVHTPAVHTSDSVSPISGSPVFDVRGLGWDTLGVSVHGQKVSQALANAGLDWRVIPRPILVDGCEVEGRVANVRSDLPPGSNVLEIVGSKYKIIQNSDALAFVEDVIGNGDVVLERAGAFNGGKTVYLQASTKGLKVGGEQIDPYILFSNSHDGSSAVRVALTAVRVVCKNTLALALRTAPRVWSVMHTKNAEGSMKAARESMNFIGEYLTEMPEIIERMQDITISEKQFVKITNTLFPVPVLSEKNKTAHKNAKYVQNVFERAYEDTPDNKRWVGTAWGVYNAYTDYTSHIQPIRESLTFEENRFARTIQGRHIENAQRVILQAASA